MTGEQMRPVARALLSVSDKTDITEFAKGLASLGVELLSTGGTYRTISEAGVAVTEVSAHTGFPEMMDGRVKTLHPKIHGGILGRRDVDQAVMAEAVSACINEFAAPEPQRWFAAYFLRYIAPHVQDKAVLLPTIQPLVAVVESLPEERPADVPPKGQGFWGLEESVREALAALAEIAPLVEDHEALAAAMPTVLVQVQHPIVRDDVMWARQVWRLIPLRI